MTKIPDDAVVVFTADERERVDDELAAADRIMSDAARQHHATFVRTGGRGWLGRELRKRVGFRTFSLQLLLNPDYLTDSRWHYVLSTKWSRSLFGGYFVRLLSYDVLRQFSAVEVRDEHEVGAAIFEAMRGVSSR